MMPSLTETMVPSFLASLTTLNCEILCLMRSAISVEFSCI